ncbi:Chemotaxis regulator - transmits chemoreceptor signals to flagelllar motor components CheY [Olavius algarvensis Delta 1 endosymbiont]|nr:Chemotaxis regulator - transmits chemoreceptor signals to flagelllar motor components CheY [Olavius algarvensis Delta 1 endosymbiont]
MALKVLTVDDSKTIRMIVKKAFKKYDCEMFEAENGVEGLAAAAKEKPGLIVLDITMPVMNGIEMLEKLKGEPALKDIPVIMLTAESGKDNVMQIVKMGVKDYIVKPFKGEDLIGRVEKIMKLAPKPEDDSATGNGNKYFSEIEDVTVLALPRRVTRPVSIEVEGNLQAKLKDMAEAQKNKMVLDLCKVAETNVSLIKLIISTLRRCQNSNVAVKLVASPKQGEELKSFQETGVIPVMHSIEDARAALG